MAIGVNLFYNSMVKAVPWRKTARLAAPNGPFYIAKRPILQCRGATSASGCGSGRKAVGAKCKTFYTKHGCRRGSGSAGNTANKMPPGPWSQGGMA